VIPRATALACLYALVGWAFFTGLLVALGNVLLPAITRPVTPLVVVGLAALTAVVVAGLTLDYFRRARRDDASAALTLGVSLASIGLTLDAVLLLSTDFRYPNVEEQKTATLAVLLLLGYAVAAVVPAIVAVLRAGRRRESTGYLPQRPPP
jgi:ABC-type sulfate transport system permease subunit